MSGCVNVYCPLCMPDKNIDPELMLLCTLHNRNIGRKKPKIRPIRYTSSRSILYKSGQCYECAKRRKQK